MKRKPNLSPPTAAALRRDAEERLKEQHPKASEVSAADARRLVHELQVHQIELEMQNAELERARAEVETALAKITDLYDFAPVGYLTLSREGLVREANLACASLLNVARSALSNRSFGDFVLRTDHAALNHFLERVFSSKTRERCELTLQLKDTRPFSVELEGIVVEPGDTCRAILTNITERKHSEEDRLVLSKLESTGILAGGIAHDFNNLLATIILGLDLVPSFSSRSELEHCLEEIKETALKAQSLTQQLLTFSDGGEPLVRVTSMPGLIQKSAQLALSGSQVRCDFFIAPDMWPVMTDESQIGQVIRNLVLNAREAMPHGGTICIRTENVVGKPKDLPALPPGRYVRISVVDQGTGISPEDLPKVFDPYFSTKLRGEQKGMGLGLTICHTIIKKQGGAITLKSEPSQGTTVDLILIAAPPSQTGSTTKTIHATTTRQNRKLLVMEDDDTLRKTYGQALRMLGHEVELEATGEKTVETFQNAMNLGRPFDAVILDLTIRSGFGGRETIQALRHIEPNVRAIIMSGYADNPVIAQHEHYGFAGVLVKPFDIQQLQEALRRVFLGQQSNS